MPFSTKPRKILSQLINLTILGLILLSGPKQGSAEVHSLKRLQHDVTFSPWVSYSFLMGKAHEYIYQPSGANVPLAPGTPVGHKNSELTYEIEDMSMVGTGLAIDFFQWAVLNGNGWFQIVNGSGVIDDYDWAVPSIPQWTHWSHHEDTEVTKAKIMDIYVAFTPPFFHAGPVSFGLVSGYKEDTFKWKGRGGNFIYSDIFFRDTFGKIQENVLVSTYEQTFKLPYYGVCAMTDFKAFHLKTRIISSPWVRGCVVDHHHLRDLVMSGDFNDGNMIAVDISGTYQIKSFLALEAAFTYLKYDTPKGDMKVVEDGIPFIYKFENSLRTGLETFMFSLILSFTF